jgi:hypothetical protein
MNDLLLDHTTLEHKQGVDREKSGPTRGCKEVSDAMTQPFEHG